MKSETLVAILVAVFAVLIWYSWFHKFGITNTKPQQVGAERYNVHRQHHDPVKAAELLGEITKRNQKLIEHLQKNYVDNSLKPMNPLKNNHIDVVHGTELYTGRDLSNISEIQTREYIQARVEQLMRNYDSDKIYEISPLNPQGNTSYAEGKKKLVLCLREKHPGDDGLHDLHDVNTMMFVVIHELAHMMNNLWGHDEDSNFWYLFKFLLVRAVEIEIYEPENYALRPIVYCGLKLTYNPLFDSRIKNFES
jgi:hypothetical protein